jgi:hypothetical protein
MVVGEEEEGVVVMGEEWGWAEFEFKCEFECTAVADGHEVAGVAEA